MSNQQKKNTFYGAAAILTVSTILVKIIGAIFKIPLIAILPEEAYGDFNGAYNIYSFFLTISTAGLPVALSKTVSECHTLGRENQKHRVFRVAFCAFLFMGLFSFLCMSVFGQLVATYIIGNEKAVFCVWRWRRGAVHLLLLRLPGLCPGAHEHDAHRDLPNH